MTLGYVKVTSESPLLNGEVEVISPEKIKVLASGISLAQGPAGPAGPAGATGSTGPAGPQGVQGEQGMQGIQGIQGIQGEQGIQGIQGETGDTGNPGTNGTDGADGDHYHTTSTTSLTIVGNGNITLTLDDVNVDYTFAQDVIVAHDVTHFMTGSVVTYTESTGVLVVNVKHKTGSGTYTSWTVNLNGAVGIQGPQGIQGLTGFAWDVARVSPNGYLIGEIVNYLGIYYICIANNDALIPPSSPAYWSVYSFVGPQGDQGIQGVQGEQGIQGIQGETGAQGIQGTTGATGAAGPSFYAQSTAPSSPSVGTVWIQTP